MQHSSATPRTAGGTLRSQSPRRTRALGRRIGAAAQAGTVLALFGPLGAGKTLLTKGVAEGLGVASVVNSPTFVLMNEHAGRLRLFHIDAYRLGEPDEAFAAGLLDEREAEGVTVIEWADRLEGWLPEERIEMELAAVPGEPQARSIAWRALGDRHVALAHALERGPS